MMLGYSSLEIELALLKSAESTSCWRSGLDCLVFTAGVGENGCTNRAAICEGLEFLGVKLDPERNKVRGEEALISADDSRVKVWVIPTNEELMIAQDTAALCGK